MYSEKSNTTLESSVFHFYPVHSILFNFTREARKQLIQQGMTMVGYLPTSFCRTETDVLRSTSGLSRRDRVLMIHKCLKTILSLFVKYTVKCIVTHTFDNISLRIHPVLCSYVFYLPEAKDRTGLLNENNINRNCHHFLASIQSFSSYSKDKT